MKAIYSLFFILSFLSPFFALATGKKTAPPFQTSSIKPSIQMHEKPSLKLLTSLGPSLKYETQFQKFKTSVNESDAFIRREIEDENVYKAVLNFLQMTLKNAESDLAQKKYFQTKEDLNVWLNFAADLPYEEGSLKGLLLCHEIREMIFIFLDKISPAVLADILQKDELWYSWVLTIRVPWPADRIIMTEQTRLKSPKSQYTARQIVASLQKNPYQSYAEALSKVQGPKTLELKDLEKYWSQNEISLMKNEVNHLSHIQIRMAQALYFKRMGTPPPTIQALMDKRFLNQIPIDYLTGKPMTLSP